MKPAVLALSFAAALVTLSPVAPAQAGSIVKFDRAAFVAAQAADRPIIVEVNAWWCPVCASQARTIKAALADPRNRDLLVFRINYDKQKAEWKALAARKQGTLIAYKGRTEVGRLEFQTDKDAIMALVAKTRS